MVTGTAGPMTLRRIRSWGCSNGPFRPVDAQAVSGHPHLRLFAPLPWPHDPANGWPNGPANRHQTAIEARLPPRERQSGIVAEFPQPDAGELHWGTATGPMVPKEKTLTSAPCIGYPWEPRVMRLIHAPRAARRPRVKAPHRVRHGDGEPGIAVGTADLLHSWYTRSETAHKWSRACAKAHCPRRS